MSSTSLVDFIAKYNGAQKVVLGHASQCHSFICSCRASTTSSA